MDFTQGAETRPCIVIAIDFGSTFTAVAFAHTSEPNTTLIEAWPDDSDDAEGTRSEQVPTEISFDGEDSKWGYQIPEHELRFQLFKLGLESNKKIPNSLLSLKYPSSTALPPSYDKGEADLTIAFLSHLNKHISACVRITLGYNVVETTSTRYILTVPAIWDEPAKELTLKCAKKAGFGTEVRLISEPEAAAMYVLSSRAFAPKRDDVFVICDAGGGTIDLISYAIEDLNSPIVLREAAPGFGQAAGSSYLNRIFGDFLEKLLGACEGWGDDTLRDAMERFEMITKRKFTGNESTFTIPVPGVEDNEAKHVKRGRLTLQAADLKSIFDTVVSVITTMISSQIQRTSNVKAVFLVGGFGANVYLREMIKKVVGENIEVVQPPNAWTSIVRGALLRGLADIDPNNSKIKITSRAARKSYGMPLCYRYEPRKHDGRKKYWSDFHGHYRIRLIDWVIKQGTLVDESKPLINSYVFCYPLAKGPVKKTEDWVCCFVAEQEEIPPMYPDGSKMLVKLVADLSKIPVALIPRTEGKDGREYYAFNYQIRAKFDSASTEWSLWYLDVCYGSVEAEYI